MKQKTPLTLALAAFALIACTDYKLPDEQQKSVPRTSSDTASDSITGNRQFQERYAKSALDLDVCPSDMQQVDSNVGADVDFNVSDRVSGGLSGRTDVSGGKNVDCN